MSRLLKIGKAAEYLGVSIQTLRRWEKSGKLSPDESRKGNTRYYDESKLLKTINLVSSGKGIFTQFPSSTLNGTQNGIYKVKTFERGVGKTTKNTKFSSIR